MKIDKIKTTNIIYLVIKTIMFAAGMFCILSLDYPLWMCIPLGWLGGITFVNLMESYCGL